MHKTKAIQFGSFNGILNSDELQFAVAVSAYNYARYSPDKIASLQSFKYNSVGSQDVFMNDCISIRRYKSDYKLPNDFVESCSYQ